MAQRYTRKFIDRRASMVCSELGLEYGRPYEMQPDGTYKSIPGRVVLEFNQYYGYKLVQMHNEHGAQASISEGYTAKEMVAFLSGMLEAKRVLQKKGN